jgi:hypothetical protein
MRVNEQRASFFLRMIRKLELIHQVLETPGVKGVHIQAIEWESAIEGIVKEAGLYISAQRYRYTI